MTQSRLICVLMTIEVKILYLVNEQLRFIANQSLFYELYMKLSISIALKY